MRVRVDKEGRVMVPKAVRERLGLRDGGEVEVQETAEGIVLRPVALGVFTAPTGFDIVEAIREDREERIRKLSGF